MSDIGSRCGIVNLHRTLAVHPNRVQEHLTQRMMQRKSGKVGSSREEQNPYLLATAMFLTADHHQPMEQLRVNAAGVFSRFLHQAKAPPTAEMIAAFDDCMDAASVVGKFKFMIGDVQAQMLEHTRAEARNGQPRTLSTFPPISDEEFEDAQDEAYAAFLGVENVLPPHAALAFCRGDAAAIEAWLDAGGLVDARIPFVGHTHARGGTMLMIASGPLGDEFGSLPVPDDDEMMDDEWDAIRKTFMEMLLRRGASVDAQDSTGTSALMMAARHDRPATVRLLYVPSGCQPANGRRASITKAYRGSHVRLSS